LSIARALVAGASAAALSLERDAQKLTEPEPAKEEAVYVGVDEAARTFDVSRRTVFEWIRDGMPSVRRGRVRRVSIEQARAWLDGRSR
jgi:excisionase family DNA binding protein